jgi:hypothetical protein
MRDQTVPTSCDRLRVLINGLAGESRDLELAIESLFKKVIFVRTQKKAERRK